MGAGHLDPRAFEGLLDANPHIAEVELSNYGEMFLNPRVRELLKIAHDRGVVLHADNGVNLNHVADETLRALVQYRFRSLTVSLDGATAESYGRYRLRGDFEKVIANIRRINELKHEMRSAFPVLVWQFIVFGHNEHEIETAKGMAAQLGMSFRPKISWDDDVSPVRDANLVRIQTGLPATRAEHYRQTGTAYLRSICHQLWNAPVLNWDGRLLGCCRNYWGDFGVNAFEVGFEESLASDRFLQARQMLTGGAEAVEGVPCSTCELYLKMRQDKNWITRAEIEKSAGDAGVLVAVVFDEATMNASHADVFVGPGLQVNRLLLVQPPQAQRVELRRRQAAYFKLVPGADYTIYALPKKLDPAFRTQPVSLPAVTLPVRLKARPVAQEFLLAG